MFTIQNLRGVIPSCQKIKFGIQFCLQKKSKYCYNILLQETAWHQRPGNTEEEGVGDRGRNIVSIMFQTSTNNKSVFCKNLTLDWHLHIGPVVPSKERSLDVLTGGLTIILLTNDVSDDRNDTKIIKTIIPCSGSLSQLHCTISAFSSN